MIAFRLIVVYDILLKILIQKYKRMQFKTNGNLLGMKYCKIYISLCKDNQLSKEIQLQIRQTNFWVIHKDNPYHLYNM
jgi:hypothetical protein